MHEPILYVIEPAPGVGGFYVYLIPDPSLPRRISLGHSPSRAAAQQEIGCRNYDREKQRYGRNDPTSR